MGAIVAVSGKGDAKLLDRMLERLAHRGKKSARDLGLGIRGDTRVARTPHGTACVFDGQIFNAGAIADELASSGVKVPTASTALVLAHAFEHFGPKIFSMLDGPFAIAFQAPDGTLTIARDPLGEKPVYYTLVGDTLLAASEIKAFLAHPKFRARPNTASLNKLLVFSFVPGTESMFEGVFEIPPATYIVLEPGSSPVSHVYWSLSESLFEKQEERDENEWIEDVRALVRSAVKKRLGDQRRTAAFLSGGIDSSAVVAVLRELGADVTAFSAGFGHGQPNELMFARLVAQHTGCSHRVIEIEPDQFLDLIPSIIWGLDDPLCDCITVPNFLLAREAAKVSDLIFNGEGGDPLFGGPKNKFLILGEWYRFLGDYDRPRAYLSSYHKFYDYLPELYTKDFMRETGGSKPLEDLVRPYLDDSGIKHFLNRLMHVNIKLKGGQNILVKVDKMLSANGVRPASPLFDKKLTELSFSIPPALKRRGDVEKWVFKKAVEPILPRAVVYRKKVGMGVPLNFWFKVTKLRDYTIDVITSKRARQRGYFRPEFVDDLLEQRGPRTQIGQPRHGELLWMLLAVEVWHRVFIDGDWRP
jgi:asparagine synthase (glutamine-hydrolysing)